MPSAVPPRTVAAIQRLERIQRQHGYTSGDVRDPSADAAAIRQIAEQQVIADYLDAHPMSSREAMTDGLIALVGDPAFAGAVEARAATLEAYLAESDGDVWSSLERPDRRRRLSDLVSLVESAAQERGYQIPRRPVVGTFPTYDV